MDVGRRRRASYRHGFDHDGPVNRGNKFLPESIVQTFLTNGQIDDTAAFLERRRASFTPRMMLSASWGRWSRADSRGKRKEPLSHRPRLDHDLTTRVLVTAQLSAQRMMSTILPPPATISAAPSRWATTI